MWDGPEVWDSIIIEERAAKGDLRLTLHQNTYAKKTFITYAEPVRQSLVAFLIAQDVLYPEAGEHAARFADLRRAFLAPVAHGFNRLYFAAEERGEGGGSLEEDYQAVRRGIGRENERLIIAAWEVTTASNRLRDLEKCHLRLLGEYRHAFRALHDTLRELDKGKKTVARPGRLC